MGKEELIRGLAVSRDKLSDILYQCIRKILSDGFNEDEFVQALADTLVKSGAITQ